jgi:signal transduction histidine kinase
VIPADLTRSRYDADEIDTRYFQLIADGMSRLLGFGVAAVSVLDGEDLVVVAVAAGDHVGHLPDGTPLKATDLLGKRWPVTKSLAALAEAESWGRFKFNARLRVEPDELDSWIPDLPPSDLPDAWHPRSALRAPIHAPDGALIGALAVDLPSDGRVPGPARRALLERYAEQATRAILAGLERKNLAARAKLLRTARDAVRRASTHHTLMGAIEQASEAIFEGFDVVGLRVRVFDGEEPGFVRTVAGREISISENLRARSQAAAEQLWRKGKVGVYGRQQVLSSADDVTVTAPDVLADLERNGLDSMLHIPLGSGERCWGALVLLRDRGGPLWTETECAVALDIGRDLGQVLHRARTREAQRALIRDLSALDDYQSSLITTVAAQLARPLQTIERSLEQIVDGSASVTGDGTGDGTGALAGLEHGARAMARVVDDLLLLSRLAHPDDRPAHDIVDLRSLVRSTTTALGAEAVSRGLTLSDRLLLGCAPVRGDADELTRMIGELVENSLRYTPSGGSVVVRLDQRDDDALLTVADEGIGIPAAELALVRTDFFRGAAARAMAPSGTGLGMSIVDRIARRHGGTVTIDSAVGSGTVVRVTLPLVADQA